MHRIRDRILDALNVGAFVAAVAIVLGLAAFACVSCAPEADERKPDGTPGAAELADYQATQAHLVAGHLQGPYVCSRGPGGECTKPGEGLIWAGSFLWAASCDVGRPVAEGLAAMIVRERGGLLRTEPLGEYANGRQATLDGVVGLTAGVARRVVDCGEAELWAEPIRVMREFQNAHNQRLHPGTTARYDLEFPYVRDVIAARLGVAPEPEAKRGRNLQAEVAIWARLVRTSYEVWVTRGKPENDRPHSCFRMNLGLTTYLTLETLGHSVADGYRDSFCASSLGVDLPHADHWCGRRSLVDWLGENARAPDLWEMRLQRCGLWERPDGHGHTSPRVDRLVGLVLAYGWHALNAAP